MLMESGKEEQDLESKNEQIKKFNNENLTNPRPKHENFWRSFQ